MVLSNNWNKFLYFIQLILTPVDADLPSIHFLISEESLQPPELWFDTHIAPLDYFKLYAKIVEYENTMYTEKLLVRVGRLQSPLDIAEETKMIRDAMSKTWTINLKNRTFSYTAKFDKYADFVPTGTSQRYDVVHSLSNKVIFENGYPPLIYDLFLRKEDDTPDVVLKKTHFCERVRLSRSEWEGGFQEIRLYLDSEGHTTGEAVLEFFKAESQIKSQTCLEWALNTSLLGLKENVCTCENQLVYSKLRCPKL